MVYPKAGGDDVKKYILVIIACLTLGLAPFFPEPHIVGKIRWILRGTNGMSQIDWWDTILHGALWVVLLYFLLHDLIAKLRSQ